MVASVGYVGAQGPGEAVRWVWAQGEPVTSADVLDGVRGSRMNVAMGENGRDREPRSASGCRVNTGPGGLPGSVEPRRS
jgi:hypothetical protein